MAHNTFKIKSILAMLLGGKLFDELPALEIGVDDFTEAIHHLEIGVQSTYSGGS